MVKPEPLGIALPPSRDPTLHGARRMFLAKLAELHAEAHRIGLHRTGHRLHEAVQESGFEQAELENKLGWSTEKGK